MNTDTCARAVAVRVTIMTSLLTTQLTCTTDLVWTCPPSCRNGDSRAATWPPSSATRGFHRVSTNRRCCCAAFVGFIIRLQATCRFQPNIGFTFDRALMVFTRSDITPLKVNRFGWNLEHSEYIVWGWPWQILGVIRAVARAGKSGEIWVC